MSFQGKARKHGRRWFSLDPPGKRGKTYYHVLGNFKLQDFLDNARGDELMAAIESGRVRYERIDDVTDRIIMLDEADQPNGADSGGEK